MLALRTKQGEHLRRLAVGTPDPMWYAGVELSGLADGESELLLAEDEPGMSVEGHRTVCIAHNESLSALTAGHRAQAPVDNPLSATTA